MHVVFDTVSQDNGGKARVDFWKNNQLVGSATDIKTLVEDSDYCNAILLRTYWNSSSGVPRNQTWYWDDAAIAIKNNQRDDSTHLIDADNNIKFIGSNNSNPPSASTQSIIFNESFESGKMDTQKDAGNLNNIGFKWESNNNTSIINSLAEIWSNGVKNTPKPTSKDWTALDGQNSLRFRYAAYSTGSGNEVWSEQRFNMQPQNELWLQWSFRVPTNYSHDNADAGAANNKFISIWMDDYEGRGIGSTFWLSMEKGADATKTNLAWTYSAGQKTGSKTMREQVPFIDANTDKGKWITVRLHLKNASSNDQSDGMVETWIKKHPDTTFKKIHEDKAVAFYSDAIKGFRAGYFFGWANGAFSNETEFLLDNIKIYDKGFPK